MKYLFYLRRPNLNLKLILSAKDWYKEQLKWEHTFCILFVFVACCEMSLKNFVHTPINTEQQHRIQEKRDTVLKFAPWIVFKKKCKSSQFKPHTYTKTKLIENPHVAFVLMWLWLNRKHYILRPSLFLISKSDLKRIFTDSRRWKDSKMLI